MAADLDVRRASGRRPRRAHAAVRCLVDALLREDREQAWGLALEHLHAGGSRLAVFADLLHPAQDRLAELWYQSQISVADEGRAAETVLAITRRLPPTPGPSRPPDSRCLLAALPDEEHML